MTTATMDQRQTTTIAAPITPEELVGYINAVTTATKNATYYGTKDEQVGALVQKIDKMIGVCRPFAALMCLSGGITDSARMATAMRLMQVMPDPRPLPGTATAEEMRRWEAYVINDMLDKMPVTRVLDLFNLFIGYRHVEEVSETAAVFAQQAGAKAKAKLVFKKDDVAVGGRYIKGVMKSYILRNAGKLDFWSVKYRKDFRKLAVHLHMDVKKHPEIAWIFGNAGVGVVQKAVDVCRRAAASKAPASLWKLPYEVARGFALNKFNIGKEDFEKKFSDKGKKTIKEQRTSAKRTKAAGGTVDLDPARLSLFDLFVYLGGQDEIPHDARKWISKAAVREASNLGLSFDEVAVVVDTSKSMFGTRQAPRHPLFKSMSLAHAIRKATKTRFGMYYTTDQGINGDGEQKHPVIPKLYGATSYAMPMIQAIRDGFKKIIVIGDGYENAPDGLTHKMLVALKEKVDTADEYSFLHLNPVHAAESSEGVKELSPYLPAAGIRSTSGIGYSMFLAMAKQYPVKALEAYLVELIKLQSGKAKVFMPEPVQKLAESYGE